MKKFGYTLVEVMIALAVFAILSVATATAIYHAFNTRAQLNVQSERLNTIRMAIALIQRATQQVVVRNVRGSDMRLFPAFVGNNNYFEFTTGGETNPNATLLKSTLKRVAFICQNHQLKRRSWVSLDTAYRKQYQDSILIGSLQRCSFAYLANNRQILDEWRENPVKQNQKLEPVPMAIKITLTLKDNQELSLLFALPSGLYA